MVWTVAHLPSYGASRGGHSLLLKGAYPSSQLKSMHTCHICALDTRSDVILIATTTIKLIRDFLIQSSRLEVINLRTHSISLL